MRTLNGGITKPVTLRDLQGPAGDLVGQAVFSFDRFSILGPWAIAGQHGWRAGRHTILLTRACNSSRVTRVS